MDGYAIALLTVLVGVLALVWRDRVRNFSVRALILGLLCAEFLSNLAPESRIVNLAIIDLILCLWFFFVIRMSRPSPPEWAYWCLALHVVMLTVHVLQHAEQAPVWIYMSAINALVYASALAISWTHFGQLAGRVHGWIVSGAPGSGGRGVARMGAHIDEREER